MVEECAGGEIVDTWLYLLGFKYNEKTIVIFLATKQPRKSKTEIFPWHLANLNFEIRFIISLLLQWLQPIGLHYIVNAYMHTNLMDRASKP